MEQTPAANCTDVQDISSNRENIQPTTPTESTNSKLDIGEFILKAISAMKPTKPDMKAVKRYLSQHDGLDVKALDKDIKKFISSAVKSGLLSKSEGKFQVAARRRRKRNVDVSVSRKKTPKSYKTASN